MDRAEAQETFRLDCGEEVSLEGLYCHETYGGYLEGRLERINQDILSNAATYMDKFWGHAKLCCFPCLKKSFGGNCQNGKCMYG